MLSEDLTAKNIIFYSFHSEWWSILFFLLQSNWNEIGCRILFSRLFLGLAGLHCSRPPLPNCIYWKRKRGNPISHLSNLLSSSDPLFSAHFKIFQHQKYWHTNPIDINNFAARIYIDLHRMPSRIRKNKVPESWTKDKRS